MHKIKKYGMAALLFAIVSCSNLSNFCRHNNWDQSFRYQDALSPHLSLQPHPSSVRVDMNTPKATPITWQQLKDVTFELRFNKELQLDLNYPVFGESLKKLKGKTVSITGYLIPLNADEGLYALSANNFASCFFCGRAGAESVVSLKFKKSPRRYKTDEYLKMKGRLELNDTNYRDFIYIFRETEEEKP